MSYRSAGRTSRPGIPWVGTPFGILLAGSAFLMGLGAQAAAEPIALPEQSDWTLHGTVLEAGSSGAWDTRLHGQISPCAVVKDDGRYHLYYIGADGNRSTDGGPRHRALGLATSEDGVTFTRHSHNPVLSYLPHDNEEEGIFSAGAAFGDDGRVLVHYGAIWARNATTESVHCNVALATGDDPSSLSDRGTVLEWNDPAVWGWGDELTPLGTFINGDTFHVYYVAKGHEGLWHLALASGPAADNLTRTRPAIESKPYVIGGCDPIRISQDRIALFVVRDFNRNVIEVRTAPVSAPHRLSKPKLTYRFPGYRHTVVFLDRKAGRWFMYQRRAEDNRVIVRTSPARNE